MRKDKRIRLQKQGWNTGDATGFLGLTNWERAYVEIKLRLAEELRARREREGTTQEVIAEVLGSSQSRVAKMEAGDRSVSLDLIVRALLRLGASERDLARVIRS